MNIEANKFNYFLHKIADPSFNIWVQKGNLILTKNQLGQGSSLEEKVKGIVSYLSSRKTPLSDKQLKLVQTIKHNLSAAVKSLDQEIQKNIKPYLDQLDHINAPSSFKPVEVSLQVAAPPTNKDEFASNLQLMLEHFPRYQLHNDLSVVDTSFQSLPHDWDFDLLHENLIKKFKKYETVADLSALKDEVLNLMKMPTPIQMGVIIETSAANTKNKSMLADFMHLAMKGVPCVVNRHFFQAQADNIKSLDDFKLDNFDIYTHKKGDLCVVVPKRKSLAELGFDPKELEISKGEHLKPSEHKLDVPKEISALLLNDNEKQRFFRIVDFSGHGSYPGYLEEKDSKEKGVIAGLDSDVFQKTLEALRDKNMAFLFVSSCFSGGTNIADIRLPDYTLPCPVYVESSFDLATMQLLEGIGFEEYDATKVLNAAQKMIIPPRSAGAPFENRPRQLSLEDRGKLSQVMNYSYAVNKFTNLGSLLLPSNMRDIPRVAYALANPEEILDVSRAHQKHASKPLVDTNLNRKGYVFSDPIVPFSLSVSGELPMILLSKGGSMHHVIKEILAPQQSLEDIAKETFNAFHDLTDRKKNEPAIKTFFIGQLKCRYEGKEVTLKRVMIKNTFKEREILLQVEGEQDFRKLKFKKGDSPAYPWKMDNTSTVSFMKGVQEIYQNTVASAPSSAALVNATAGKQSQADFVDALDQTFFGEQMPEQGKLFSALIKDSFSSPEKGAELKPTLTSLKQKISNRQELLKFMGDAGELAKNLKLSNLGVIINQASYTPLMDAAKEGNKDKAEMILKDNPQTLNEVNANNSVALTIALVNKHYDLAKMFIDQGANLYHTNKNGYSPMRIICEEAEPAFLEWVINQKKVDLIGNEGGKLLMDCLDAKNWKLVNFLVDRQAGVNADQSKHPLLAHAIWQGGDKEIIKKLLHYPGMDVNDVNQRLSDRRNTPLQAAIYNQDVEVLKLLLESGADPNLTDDHQDSPLNFVTMYGKEKSLEFAKLLVEAGAKVNLPNTDGQAALFFSANFKDKPLIEYLIRKGASLETADIANGVNALEVADSKPGILEFILQIPGIDINPRTGRLDKLFQEAVKDGDLKKADLLLGNGVNINQPIEKGVPPLLHYLRNMPAKADPLPVVKFFLDHGGDLMQQDNEGNTVMHWTLEKQNLPVLKCLKEAGIPYDRPANNKGVTPFMLGFSAEPNIAFIEELLHDKDLRRRDLPAIMKQCLEKWGLKHPEAVAVMMKRFMDEPKIEKWPESICGVPKLQAYFYLGYESDENTRKLILSQIDLFPRSVNEQYIQATVQLTKNLVVLKALIKKGAEIGSKPLLDFCDLELIKLLEAKGVDLSGEVGIHYLKQFVSKKYANADQKDGVLYLLSKIQESPHGALSWAFQGGKQELIDLVLEHPKMNVLATDPTVDSPMAWAIGEKNEAVLKKLISKNAVYSPPIHFDAEVFKNPLIRLLSADGGKESDAMLAMAKILVESGYDHCVNERVKNDMTPLNSAVCNHQMRMAVFLIEHGADVHLANNKGNTPLHHAVQLAVAMKEDELIPLFKLLLSKGAKWDVPNHDGQTARNLAVKLRLGTVLQLMK